MKNKMGILDNFKKFTETNPESKDILRPDLGIISWSNLGDEEKKAIWYNLSGLFFELKAGQYRYNFDNSFLYGNQKDQILTSSIIEFNSENKISNLCKNYLKAKGDDRINLACGKDFIEIFFNGTKEAFYELLSIYMKNIIEEYIKGYISEKEGENEEDYKKRVEEIETSKANKVLDYLDHTFKQFRIEYKLTLAGYIARQEESIIENAYIPTIKLLGNKKWEDVSIELGKAFKEYESGNYSDTIRECVNTIEGFLQIMIYGKKIGKQGLNEHYKEAVKKGFIKEDKITKTLTDAFISQLALDRKMKGNSHTTLGEADENDALFILNLTVINLQHWITQYNLNNIH